MFTRVPKMSATSESREPREPPTSITGFVVDRTKIAVRNTKKCFKKGKSWKAMFGLILKAPFIITGVVVAVPIDIALTVVLAFGNIAGSCLDCNVSGCCDPISRY